VHGAYHAFGEKCEMINRIKSKNKRRAKHSLYAPVKARTQLRDSGSGRRWACMIMRSGE